LNASHTQSLLDTCLCYYLYSISQNINHPTQLLTYTLTIVACPKTNPNANTNLNCKTVSQCDSYICHKSSQKFQSYSFKAIQNHKFATFRPTNELITRYDGF